MKTYQFKALLQNEGWLEQAYVSVDSQGIIIRLGSEKPETGEIYNIPGLAIPGFQNAHSHAFQYAMAGLAEKHQTRMQDDFWGWRDAMYQLALSLNPDQMESIATMLYAEMVRHGYTHVAEFHYLHHEANGQPFEDLAEMGGRLIAAAKTAGIGITLIPVFYQKGGFDQPPTERQRRFISADLEDYWRLLEASEAACGAYEAANLAMGMHSMRGVEPPLIAEAAISGRQDLPFHMHVSEQLKEISDSIAALGSRPVEWMLDHVPLSERFHLVHATHLTEMETIGLAGSGAHVVLCPSTEGNLGDGFFPLDNYQEYGGRWSIGTDSHIGINPLEELRLLDYGQRLTSHRRNTLMSPEENDAGMFALQMATRSGRKAMGNQESRFFKIGQPLDACILDAEAPLLACSSPVSRASTIVYASNPDMQWGTICKGELMVKGRQHVGYESISANFVRAIRQLGNR